MADRPRVTAIGEQTSLADRKRRAGQRLLIGFEHPYVDEDLRRLVAELQPAGFVLFARNVEEPTQVLELNRELASLVDPSRPALLAVDQEGGRVQRIREPATVWPPMLVVGRAGEHTAEVSRALAIELRAMGFNLNFAPVADVHSEPTNPIIGDRAFGEDAVTVSKHVVDFVRAHQEHGIIACAKHFPGHGDTTVDSHLDLPYVEKEEPDLRHVELPPFEAAVRAGVGTVMTSHVVYPAFDEDLPAGFSRRVTRRLLREELGFEGVVFSDDLEMKAVHGRFSVDQQARLLTEAGVDVLLCCRSPELQVEFFETLVREQEADAGFERGCIDAVDRLQALRERFLPLAPPRPGLEVVGSPRHRDLAALVSARGGA